jgi:hypothetical protein
MDENQLHAEMSAGTRAASALGTFEQAFEHLRAAYFKAWQASAAGDSDARERLWQASQIIGAVEAHLKHVKSGGEIAERQLAQITQLAAE